MDERPEHTAAAPGGAREEPGKTSSRALAGVVQFPDLIGERRRAACAVIRDELGNIPDFRMEKVQDAQERINDRFYERPEILEKVIERLLADVRISS